MPIDAGRLRVKPGRWERATNAQQRRLVRAYDTWAAGVKAELNATLKHLASPVLLQSIIARRLPELEKALLEATHDGIQTAERLVIGRAQPSRRVAEVQARHLTRNDQLVNQNLVPFIGERLAGAMTGAVDAKAVTQALTAQRLFPAQYAGGFWAMIFETKQAAGLDEDDSRRQQGLPPVKVKWVLDSQAEHCQASPGRYGCPELAGEYDSWGVLPTVPAGQVTCAGNCLLVGQSVEFTGLQAAMRSWYSGPALELLTEKGFKLAVTPNHPVLTPQGWLAAQSLHPGNYVVSGSFGKSILQAIHEYNEHMPTLVEEIWRALSIPSGQAAFRHTFQAMPVNFHGDGRFVDGDVEIIWANGQLPGDNYSPLLEQRREGDFVKVGLGQSLLSAQSPPVQIGHISLLAQDSFMGIPYLPPPLLGSHLSPLESLGLTLVPKLDASSCKSPGERASAYPRILRQMQQAFAAEVTLDEIVQVRDFHFSGHVFDLQTDTGYFLAGNSIAQRQGIVVSNCRCVVEVWRDGRWQR